MRQLHLDRRRGEVVLEDVPEPSLREAAVLVRTAFSALSPGTERAMTELSRGHLLKAVRSRPDLVQRVIASARKDGVLATWRRVRDKLDAPQALGGSSSGTVIAVAPGVRDVSPGDRVACAGAGEAVHADVACVPVALVARVPDGVGLDRAATAGLGSIALHATRQAGIALGERAGVIGCGTLGLLCAQLLRASGARVIAFDPDEDAVRAARAMGLEAVQSRDPDEQAGAALAFSAGVGLDAVIVAASSSDDTPMRAAALASRDRGRVVAMGLVPFGLPREIAYARELELRISRSGGPGRHDPDFEVRGNDYPHGAVRWTETRNLAAFLELLEIGAVDVDGLVSRKLQPEAAREAHARQASGEPLRAALIEFAGNAPVVVERVAKSARSPRTARRARPSGPAVGVAVIGTGAFATSTILPILARADDVTLEHVVSGRGLSAERAKQKFGARASGTDFAAAIEDVRVDLVLVLTRHDLHAAQVVAALEAGKHVFVEKPLAMSLADIDAIEAAALAGGGVLLTGFNRRFAPAMVEVAELVRGRGALLMSQRVCAPVSPGHWLDDPLIGGGRIAGEACHFIDALSFLAGDPGIVRASARRAGSDVDIAITLELADGSVGQILYAGSASPRASKERLEVHAASASIVLEEAQTGHALLGGRKQRLRGRGKGHAEEMAALMTAVRSGGPSPVPLETQLAVARAVVAAQDSLSRVVGPEHDRE